MSHYLAFRFIKDENINFFDGLRHTIYKNKNPVSKIKTPEEMDKIIGKAIEEFYVSNKTAIFLSGGMDSAIVASYLPKKTKAYTFKCIAEGAIDETAQAQKYADKYSLDQEIVEMNWSDFEKLTPEILKFDQTPFHSIEVQLVKVAKLAKSQGFDKIIIGDAADYVFGGMDKLLSKDWDFDSFVKRYNYIEPKRALKDYIDITNEYEKFRLPDNKIDFVKITQTDMLEESLNSYASAFAKEGIEFLDPYSFMEMQEPLDLNRIRNGESKYLVRELFKLHYPEIDIPEKIPMPRAMNQWLKDFKVSRDEFIPNCTDDMTGDQKWQIYCLETFLNMHDKGQL